MNEIDTEPIDVDALRAAFDRRGEQLLTQRVALVDALQRALNENDELRAQVGDLELARQNARELHTGLVEAHRQIEDLDAQLQAVYATATFRATDKLRRVYGKVRGATGAS